MPADLLRRATPWHKVCGVSGALRASAACTLGVALISLVGCASAPSLNQTPSPNSGTTAANVPNPVGKLTPGQAQDVTLYAMTLVGTPYRYGGNTPEGGFDCSGLIGHVYQTNAGLQPPRTTAKLQFWGNAVALEQVRMGDLVVFLNSNNTANHAGIYVGSNRFVHAPSTGGVVRLDSLAGKHWAAQTVVVRRP
ncbi:MAG: hydrolase Nlp/P60 [Burkholderiales bacterium PBB3]|nr:MAG: hydrolase Nlp/P60 [Burkholderiales bacterium PBB3]